DVGLATEPARTDAALLLQNVRAEGLAPAQTAGGGHLDALGGAPVCLHLRHYVIPLRLMLRLRWSRFPRRQAAHFRSPRWRGPSPRLPRSQLPGGPLLWGAHG